MKHAIGSAANGADVYVDLLRPGVAGQIAQQPYLLVLAGEALRKTALTGPEAKIECDMQRVIGYDFIVDTNDTDTVFYARLVRGDAYIRFVKSGKPAAARHLTLILYRQDDGSYELTDIRIGRSVPPLPGGRDETPQSRPYWDAHAIIRDSQPIQSRTLTKTCPY